MIPFATFSPPPASSLFGPAVTGQERVDPATLPTHITPPINEAFRGEHDLKQPTVISRAVIAPPAEGNRSPTIKLAAPSLFLVQFIAQATGQSGVFAAEAKPAIATEKAIRAFNNAESLAADVAAEEIEKPEDMESLESISMLV